MRHVGHLNSQSSSNVVYKVIFLTRHGVGYHNDKHAQVGDELWEVLALVFALVYSSITLIPGFWLLVFHIITSFISFLLSSVAVKLTY